MPRKANPHNEAESQRPLVDDLRVERWLEQAQCEQELDALEQLLGADLHQLLQ